MTSKDTNSAEIINAESNKHYCVIHKKDVNDTKYSEAQKQSEKLIFNELQIDVDQMCNLKSECHNKTSAMEKQEEQSTEVVGYQLKFDNHDQANKNSENDIQNQNEYDETIDERLPETVTLLTTPNGGKLYLVGTAHFSVQSQNDVAMIIRAVQPHIVAVELCKARIDFLNIAEEVLYRNATDLSLKSLTDMLKEYGLYGFLHFILHRMVTHVVKELGMPPGGEFRTAFEEAKKVPNCIIQLADRSISITVQRAVRALSWWEIIKLLWLVRHLDTHINEQDVERYKRKHVIEEMITTMKEEYPAIERTFVKERDVYLTYHLQAATMVKHSPGLKPPRIVGVVGIGHVNGIVENWGKVRSSDIWPIMRVPPQSLSSRILKFTFKASLLGVAVYVGYKIIPLPYGSALQSIRSSIEGLFQVSDRT
ncbi:traB domain-containing protein isoform X1 [Megachile rotundata]|uniref:traB domain-containing protein isoform X1 n=1 Tax=Megachile rotundata TaxID=143995 RepID=UPI00061534CE|nr:PREDICTED: traB domain-containing protein isoform X1 [Megachile rotundata]XP_012135958.1 PREDICTED: traB domain-containing protein isoform X1 [Megachile rotundata]XP_012135959.1 PREDICTED: traB domain-containing protein isoform X1 [Megachile rotundata]